MSNPSDAIYAFDALGIDGKKVNLDTVIYTRQAAKRLELDPARMMVNIDRFANTTTATIPTALHQAFEEKRMAKGDLVALAARNAQAIGAGHSFIVFLGNAYPESRLAADKHIDFDIAWMEPIQAQLLGPADG